MKKRIMNEWYARDSSRKISAVFTDRMERGLRCSGAIPYGYYQSHVLQMVRDGFQAAGHAGDCILLLDRLFLTTQAIRLMGELNGSGGHNRLDIVTKAKRNCTAFEEPPPRPAGKRGAPRKKGDSVRLSRLFSDEASFTEASAKIYGQTKKVRYLSWDLLWGQRLYRKLRFVLVTYDGKKSILA